MRLATSVPALAVAIAVQSVALTVATAQPRDERPLSRQQAARNELGILEYCQAQGLVDETVVSREREMVHQSVDVSASSPVGSREEDLGRAGFLAFGERQGRFEESALAQGLTLKTACASRAALALSGGRR